MTRLAYIPVGPKLPRRRQKYLVVPAPPDEILHDRLQFDVRIVESMAARMSREMHRHSPEHGRAVMRVMTFGAHHKIVHMPDGSKLHVWTDIDLAP
jgi:hypothetical protein